ncbi:DUF6982 domain-containing protein [Mesoterricola sediminis]|uniref:Uncharacterized protein n=1 Tax=Mesoterricola sediminis TaxID=2927980 RepID=A0AA48GU57_9BACT|nr:hypothetical protein [Mesoterricola sediminis]BDU77814.1 hypothetical protein METESE_27720 [Mesoterricola sediminis]
MNQVVARYQDGHLIKGHTVDFTPTSERFHVYPLGSYPGAKPLEIDVTDLKGVFFVKNLQGNPAHVKRNIFEPTNLTPGRKVRVVFKDGEVLLGHAQGYHPERKGFFILPADQRSNNERCYVLAAATREVSILGA